MRTARSIIATVLSLLLIFPTSGVAYADIYAYSSDTEKVLDSFAEEYGWNPDFIDAAEWDGILPDITYRRNENHQREYFDDLYAESKAYCVENNIIKVSSFGGFGGRRLASVARAEVGAPDSMEIPPGSNRTKYNDWYYNQVGAEAPWCAIFVSRCAEQCGFIESGLFRKDAGVTTTFAYMTQENGFDSYTWREIKQLGGGAYSPSPGDIYFFEGMGHIGIVTNVTEDAIEVTHGNSSGNNVKATLISSSGYMNHGTIVHVIYGLGSGDYSQDEVVEAIFYFLVDYMGVPVSSAAGVIANIEAESTFNVNAYGDVDIGGSIGICQWYDRKDRLISWCDSNGYDYLSLEGQLFYMEYELHNFYPNTYNYIMAQPENAQGAYNAAYFWCVDFESPSYEEIKGAKRGTRAMEYWYPMFA